MELQCQLIARAGNQFVLAKLVQIHDHTCGGAGVRPDTHAVHAVVADMNAIHRGGHCRVRQIHDDARWRGKCLHLGRDSTFGRHLDADAAISRHDCDLLQRSTRHRRSRIPSLRSCHQYDGQQRDYCSQHLLSHFPLPAFIYSPLDFVLNFSVQ